MALSSRFEVPATYATLHLLRELIKRDFHARFTGSALGVAWAVLQPLSLVALYWFVFTFMIPGGRAGGSGGEYIYYLISGLSPWLGINEGLIRSTTAIVENGTIVRRVPLRSELLVVVPNVSALIFELLDPAECKSRRLPHMFLGKPLSLARPAIHQTVEKGFKFFSGSLSPFAIGQRNHA